MRIKSLRRPQYIKLEIKKTKDLDPLENLKHLKMKNKSFYKLFQSLT